MIKKTYCHRLMSPHLEALAEPVLADVELLEAGQLGEQLDVGEGGVLQVELLQLAELLRQALERCEQQP